MQHTALSELLTEIIEARAYARVKAEYDALDDDGKRQQEFVRRSELAQKVQEIEFELIAEARARDAEGRR